MSAALPRLLVSDVDGTLLRDDKQLSDRTVEAVARLIERGVLVSLISARPPSGILWIAQRLGLDGPFGAFNGGTIFMADGTIRHARRLPNGLLPEMVALIENGGAEPWVYAGGKWFLREVGNPHVARERQSAGLEPSLIDDLGGITAPVDKIVGVSDDHALLARVEAAAVAAHGEQARIACSSPYYLDVTAKRANKGDGIAAIAEALSVTLEETLVIGDMTNDLAMFERAGRSVAMAQAPENVRNAADRVTGTNDEDGVADVIERLLADSAI